MKTKKIIKRFNFIYRVFLALLCVVLFLNLAACASKPPCQIDLSPAKKIKKPTSKPPVHLTNQQIRDFYLCQLKTHGVYIIHVGQTWKLIFPSDAVFENETASIDPSYEPILLMAANFLKTFHKITIKVAGFSDNTDTSFKEKSGSSIKSDLTTEQAQSVVNYFWQQCINARLIYAVGDDGKHPIAWNGSEMGRALNRRIEVSFRAYHNSTAWY